jgi:hypothetical protein
MQEMIRTEGKPPRNRDQDIPPRKVDSIESPETPKPGPERGKDEPDRNAPLPEEETYEREPLN